MRSELVLTSILAVTLLLFSSETYWLPVHDNSLLKYYHETCSTA